MKRKLTRSEMITLLQDLAAGKVQLRSLAPIEHVTSFYHCYDDGVDEDVTDQIVSKEKLENRNKVLQMASENKGGNIIHHQVFFTDYSREPKLSSDPRK